jgi:hypothetical protein
MHCFEVSTVTVSSVRSSKAAFAVRDLFLSLFCLVARLASYLALSSSVNIAVETRTPSMPKEQRGALGLLVPRHKRTQSHHFVCAHTHTHAHAHLIGKRRPHSRCDPGSTAQHSTAQHSTAQHGTAWHGTARHIGKAADPVTTGTTAHPPTACALMFSLSCYVLISYFRISLQLGCKLVQICVVFVRRS